MTEAAELDRLLSRAAAELPTETVFGARPVSVVLDGGAIGKWTVSLAGTRAEVRHGRVRRPTATLCGDPSVIADITRGEESGVRAFLAGRITARGDLGAVIALGGLLADPDDVRAPRARCVEVGGIRTRYLEAGPPDAPVVVCVHGLGASSASFLTTVDDLSADHRVIAPDMPGFGDSDAPRARYTPGWLGHWLVSFVRAVGARGAPLIGNSLGGRVAIESALLAPRDIGPLIALCPSPAFRRLRQFVPFVRVLPPGVTRAMPIRMRHRDVVRGVHALFADPSRLAPAWHDAAADDFLRVTRDPAHRVAFFSALREIYLETAFGADGFWDRLPGLGGRALFVWGEKDRLVPAKFARHVTDALPASESVVLPDCGHVPQFELPDRTHALVRAFLAGRDLGLPSPVDLA